MSKCQACPAARVEYLPRPREWLDYKTSENAAFLTGDDRHDLNSEMLEIGGP